MPYGIPPEKGGESMANLAKMEACVTAVARANPSWDKSRVIATCKVRLGLTKSGEQKGR